VTRAAAALAAAGLFLSAHAASAQALPPETVARIDAVVQEALKSSGAPAASIAIVRDDRLVLARAYGKARLETGAAASPDQRFPIGSVSKQFTAAAVLLLAEDGKLKLDDPVGKWVPGLTAGDRITIRQILSHTAGYRDFWPQDYVWSAMQKPVTPQAILDRWARVPLDFQPGEQWQYSNTGFVLAALIVEKASGQRFDDFLHARIFAPLGMTSVTEVVDHPLPAGDPGGYTRYALGPPRPAPKEGPGWLFGAGGLAMTAGDLAKWDLARIDRKLLKPASWRLMETSVRLNNGRDARYGLGVAATSDGQLRLVQHGGAISGFLADNRVWPEARAAMVVFVNGDYGDPGGIANAVGQVLPLASRPSAAETAKARAFLEDLRAGHLRRDELTDDARDYFDEAAVADFKSSLGGLGAITAFEPVARALRGGFDQEVYEATLGKTKVRIVARGDGQKYEQFMVLPD
jgi:CubicO group peptidase (beta-lactamase class C family)